MSADRDIHLTRSLLIDGNALLRSVTAGQLRELGVGQVTAVSRIADARLALERDPFDIVVCSLELDGGEQSGQDLLDELRREQLLPHSTVFIMVAASASYHQVMEAAEAALDGFVVRPYTAETLAQRVRDARARKRELADVLRALDAGDTDAVLVHAIRRFKDRAPYAIWCGRLAAELMLRAGRADDALMLFRKLVALRPASWSRLGVARALLARGDGAEARRRLAETLEADPACADAHDLLGRLLVEQCDFDGALEEYRRAADLTPACLLRQQHAGALAFYQGEADEALARLEQAIALGVRSKLFDALTLHMIAALRFDRGDARGVAAMADQLRGFRRRHPESQRLARLELGVAALHGALAGQAATTAQALQSLGQQVDDDDFDLEAATVLLGLLQRLRGRHGAGDAIETLTRRIGSRFAVSKAIVEVLVAAAGRAALASRWLRECQTEIATQAEAALALALNGEPGEAVAQLLTSARASRNARLVELARSLLRRHQAAVGDAPVLAQEADTLLARWGHAVNHIAGIQRAGRAPGAMHLRGPDPARVAA